MPSLLDESPSYRPFLAPWAVKIARDHEASHWVEDEAPVSDDVFDWKAGKLTEGEKEFVTQILRMFTQSDCSVGQLYYSQLIPKFRNNEIRNMLGSFACREAIHQRAYALLNDTLGLPEGEYTAFMSYVEMNEKNEFMVNVDTSTDAGLALALAKGVFNEGVSLFASFVTLLNFQRRGLMKGMGKVVEWSVRDEDQHVNGVAHLFRAFCEEKPHIVNSHFKSKIYAMAREVVRLEDAFLDLAYKSTTIEGLPIEDVKQYIRYIADRRLIQLGLRGNFKVKENPLPWLDWILNAVSHTSFFEQRVSDYSVAGLKGEWSYPDRSQHFLIYTRSNCQFCTKSKELLTLEGYDFTEIDLSDDDTRHDFFEDYGLQGDQRTMPKIYTLTDDDQETLIGGFTELQNYVINT